MNATRQQPVSVTDTDEHPGNIVSLDDYRPSSSTPSQQQASPLAALDIQSAESDVLVYQGTVAGPVRTLVWTMSRESASYSLLTGFHDTLELDNGGSYERAAYEEVKGRFIERVVSSLRDTPVEEGYSHPADQLIKDAVTEFPAAPQWVQSIYVENIAVAQDISIGVLRCAGRLPYALVDPWGMVMTVGALSHHNIEVREAAVRAFERWGGQMSIDILESRVAAEPIPWMADYLRQVILDLSS